MGIKKLKKENNYLNLTLVDMLSKFDPSKTKKYTQFLVNIVSNRLKEQLKYTIEHENSEFNRKEVEKLVPFDSFENTITRMFICEYLFTWSEMDSFVDFCNLMERGLTNEKDISKYDTWEMMEKELFGAKNKASIKKAEKEIQIIPSDERYLIFKPLTYLASTTYGYQTKWCTAMITDPLYFYTHSKGILIYLIDRETNKRFAFHKRIPGPYDIEDHEDLIFTCWNEEDKKLDTFQTGIPYDVLKIIADQMDTSNPNNIANYKHFSEDELKLMVKYTDFPESHLLVSLEQTETTTQAIMRRLVPRRPRYFNQTLLTEPEPTSQESSWPNEEELPLENIFIPPGGDILERFGVMAKDELCVDDLPI
jgi:hypothetical protein